MKRHRSRRQRTQRRNVIGFSQSLLDSYDTSDDDSDTDDDEDGLQPPETSFSLASSVTSTNEGSVNRLDSMSTELNGLVRFIRRGVESLSGGTSEAAPAFSVLAFALEDWDI
jgi:gamma-tubulin complex component 5